MLVQPPRANINLICLFLWSYGAAWTIIIHRTLGASDLLLDGPLNTLMITLCYCVVFERISLPGPVRDENGRKREEEEEQESVRDY